MKPYQAALAAVVVVCLENLAFAQPINVVLRLAERTPLSDLAARVSDPTSDRYGNFYSPEEIRAVAGPTDADYASLVANLKADGFTIVSESKTHLTLTVRADHRVFEDQFSTKIQFARTAGLRHALVAPSIPAKYRLVQSVSGLDNTYRLHPHFVALPRAGSGTGNGATPAAQPGLLPAQIKTAYRLDSLYQQGLTGKGQDIAIATFMGFYIQDIQDYYKSVGLNPAPAVDQVTFNGTPAFDDGSAAETQLDAELSGTIAPGAKIHIFASADNSEAGELAIFTAILDDNRSKLVNYSWGSCETMVSAAHIADMDKIFARAVAQGVNIQVASGDSGADGCQNGTKVADWPASSPSVVAVGGTTLTLTSANAIATEAGWNGSGGGISSLYASPSWQSALPAPFNAKRSMPDVSFNADPNSGQAIWTHYGSSTPSWLVVGGTSMAAPQWTGFLALVNEARQAAGGTTLPYLNPILYGAKAADLANIINDIVSGTDGVYACTAGWDAVTGLGSPRADALMAYLLAH